VAGSAVFRSENPAATIERLRALAAGAKREPISETTSEPTSEH